MTGAGCGPYSAFMWRCRSCTLSTPVDTSVVVLWCPSVLRQGVLAQTVPRTVRFPQVHFLNRLACLSCCNDRCFGPDSAVHCLEVQFLDKVGIAPRVQRQVYWPRQCRTLSGGIQVQFLDKVDMPVRQVQFLDKVFDLPVGVP